MKLNAWALRLHPVDDPSTAFDVLCYATFFMDLTEAEELDVLHIHPYPEALRPRPVPTPVIRNIVLRPYPDLIRPHAALDPFRDCALARPLDEQLGELLAALHDGAPVSWRVETWAPLWTEAGPAPDYPGYIGYAHMVIHRLNFTDAAWAAGETGRELHLAGTIISDADGELLVADVAEECPALLRPVPA